MRTISRRCLAAAFVLAAAILSPIVQAQTAAPQTPASPMFPFVIPWDDATPGTATDVSSLNAKPAGVHGAIITRNGHFYEADTGVRQRFIGVSFAAKDAFPSHADAAAVAARIAKLGINIVRLHHMDNAHWGPGSSIWDPAYPDLQHIDAGQLDKLDYFVSQLKRNGVYVNINLHVSRQFTPADGFPASVNAITTSFDKRVDEFDPRMIQLQKNYAHDLLTHVNPYTHLSYAVDPCVAVVEINNENSLVGDPWATLGAGLDTLPSPFRDELVGLWNLWLARKYGTDGRLRAAWLRGVTPVGPSINTTASWSLEHQGTSDATMAVSPDAQINVTSTDGTDWHVQAHQTGLDFREGDTYTVTFRAKADAARTIGVTAGLDQADWHNIGLDTTAALTADWKTFHNTFDAHDVVPGHGRVAFVLGGQTGSVEISGLEVKPGVDGAGLAPDQSLVGNSIDIPTSSTRVQHSDWIAFLADTERAYADNMRDYLHETLHVHANIICSQISWGGLTGINREANMDFADNHAYWQHPVFPHTPWDAKDWNIGNTSQIAQFATGGGGVLSGLAQFRVAGKPYSISEYNEPAPNDFQAETVPLLAAFAAFQDWDMIYLFDYGDYGTGIDNDKIGGFFGIGPNPSKTAFLPAAAMIFRAGEYPPASAASRSAVSATLTKTDTPVTRLWSSPDPAVASDIFTRRLALVPPGVSLSQSSVLKRAPILKVGKTTSGAYLTTDLPASRFAAMIGYLGGQKTVCGSLTLDMPHFGNDFAAVTLTQMPNKSKLLTLVGKVENVGMVWNADRTSVGDQWGRGPVQAEGIPATVTLAAAAHHVYALDGTGKRVTEVPSTETNGTLTFVAGPQYRTLWYEIAP